MIGIIVLLIISWALLRLIAKKNLSALGLIPTKRNITTLITGFVLAMFTCATYHVLTTVTVNNGWTLNRQLTRYTALISIWWTLKSVLFEELLFRGALLYLAIQRFGAKTACILSAACFGVYHWFSYNAFESPLQMTIIFLITGFFGYALAFAFAKTKSLYLPIGIHFGWNLANIVLFSNGPLGKQLFMKMNAHQPEGILSLCLFLFQGLAIPIFTLLYAKRQKKGQRLALDLIH